MYVIIGSPFVPPERMLLLIVLVFVMITLNVIVRQMPLCVRQKNGVSIVQKVVVTFNVILTITNAIKICKKTKT